MEVELFRRAFALLDDTALPEEDRVDAVEALVARDAPQKAASERERLVLDMLMAHHHKRAPEDAARPQLPTKKSRPPRIPERTTGPVRERIREPPAAGVNSGRHAPSTAAATSTAASSAPPPPAAPLPPRRTAFDELRTVLGPQNSDEDIERVLAHNDFDLARTLEMLSTAHAPAAPSAAAPQSFSKEQLAERIMCKYYMASGNCLRGSACMYSHDGKQRVCRFWLQGHCLAGDECLFLHSVPREIVQRFEVQPPPPRPALPVLSALPALGAKPLPKAPAPAPAPAVVPAAAEPSLVPFRRISDVLAAPNQGRVPLAAPRLLPWKARDFGANEQYVELRLAAAKHAELRNKLLQQATAAWSQNNPAHARALSAEGQFHNGEMMDAYHAGADLLWAQRTRPSSEIYVDLHGLELGEAVDHLEARLHDVETVEKHSPRVVYVITGRGHFKAKRTADQLSQYVKAFLDKHAYKHRDFGVDATFGRVFGVDPWSAIK